MKHPFGKVMLSSVFSQDDIAHSLWTCLKLQVTSLPPRNEPLFVHRCPGTDGQTVNIWGHNTRHHCMIDCSDVEGHVCCCVVTGNLVAFRKRLMELQTAL